MQAQIANPIVDLIAQLIFPGEFEVNQQLNLFLLRV